MGGVAADGLREAGVFAELVEVPVSGDPPRGDLAETVSLLESRLMNNTAPPAAAPVLIVRVTVPFAGEIAIARSVTLRHLLAPEKAGVRAAQADGPPCWPVPSG